MKRNYSLLIVGSLVSLWVAACGGGGGDEGPPPAASEVFFGADGAQGNLSNLYKLDPVTGAVASTVGAIGFAVTGLAVHPTTRTLYGVTATANPANPGSLITINKTTGAGTLVGDLFPGINAAVTDITFTSDGMLYGWSVITDDLVTINLATGLATVVADSGLTTSGSGLAASSGNVLFFAGNLDNGPLRTVDRTTGLATIVATLNGVTSRPIGAMAFNGAGTLFGVRLNLLANPRTSELITINTTTGAVTVVGASVNRLDGIVFD